jgi:hypothetical protein
MTKDDIRAAVEKSVKAQDIDTVQKGARALHVVFLRNCTKEVLVQELMRLWDDAAKFMELDDFVECVTEDQFELMYGDWSKFEISRRNR